jgi:GT2 family glycosyltransferase
VSLPLKFDVGLSAGRNAMLASIKTKYFVLCDDDFLFYEQTRLENFRKLLEGTDLDLVAGCVMYRSDTGKFDDINLYAGNLVLDPLKNLRIEPVKLEKSFTRCDIVANWFMANTNAIRQKTGGWDPKLKVEEHTDFFWRAKIGGLKVAVTQDIKVNHTLARDNRYSLFRYARKRKYYRIYFQKLGINSFTDRWETVTLKDLQSPGLVKIILTTLHKEFVLLRKYFR